MSYFLSSNENAFTLKSLTEGLRLDGRDLIDHRSISVEFGKNSGEVSFSLGETLIISRISAEIAQPREERPSEGFLKFKVDLSLLNEDRQNTVFSAKEYSNEISKLIERVLKGSKALDPESLCIITGKAVWSINIDITLLNNAGNLIDACYMATLVGLLHFRRPFVKVENEKNIKVFSQEEKKPQPLSITHIPIAFTYAFFNEATQVIADPTDCEEEVVDGRITIVMNIYKDICLMHKPGGVPLNPAILEQLISVTEIKVGQITQFIREFLSSSEKYSIYKEKSCEKIGFHWNPLPKDPTKAPKNNEEIVNLEEMRQTIGK